MNYKKLLSGTVALMLGLSAVSVPEIMDGIQRRSGKETAENAVVDGYNSFGNYISKMTEKSQNEHTASAAVTPFFKVGEAVYDEITSYVAVTTKQSADCTLKVCICKDDESQSILRTYEERIDAEAETTRVHLPESELPEYFIIRVVLTGPLGEELCEPFFVNTCTKTVKTVEAATVDDFDDAYTVNLDENEDNNFFVLSENAVIAESDENTNVLVEADYENGVFVFDNADETVENLKEGDYFYIRPDEENIIALSVDSVTEEDDGTVTVKDSGRSIDDMFDFVKINQVIVCAPAEGDSGNSTGSSESSSDSESSDSSDKDKDEKKPTNVKVELACEDNTVKFAVTGSVGPGIETDNVTAGIFAEVSETVEFSFYKYKEDVEVKCTSLTEVGLKAEFDGKLSTSDIEALNKLTFCKFKIPTEIPGLMLDFSAGVYAEIEGKLSVSASLSTKSGFVYSKKTGFSEIEDPGRAKSAGVSAEGNFKLGIKAELSVVVLDEKIFKAGIPVFAGIEVSTTGTYNFDDLALEDLSGTEFSLPGHSEDKIHLCHFCAKGDLNVVVSLGAEIEMKALSLKAEASFKPWKFKIADWYCSESVKGFGECPNYAYRTDLSMTRDGAPADGGYFSVGKAKAAIGGGGAVLYCKNGNHSYSITSADNKTEGSGSFKIESAGYTVYLNTGDGKVIDQTGIPGDPYKYDEKDLSSFTAITDDEKAFLTASMSEGTGTIETGKLGDDITYIIYENGNMLVYGSGKMYDSSSARLKQCESVKNVLIEYNDNGPITNIGANVFNGCKNMTYITVPEGITSFGAGAFRNCSSLSKFVYNLDKEKDKDGKERPYDFKNITSVGEYAFEGCALISNSPDFSKLVTVGRSAFAGCEKLSGDISMPVVTTIGYEAFHNCASLKSVVTGDSLTTLERSAFAGCAGIKSAVIGKGVTEVVHSIFNGCTAMTDLTVSAMSTNDTISVGGGYIWANYLALMFEESAPETALEKYALKKIVLTESKAITPLQFKDLVCVEEIVLPDGVTSIGAKAFENCKALKKVNLPEGVTKIDSYAFRECSSVEKIEFPLSLTEIGYNSFINCSSLLSLDLPEKLETISNGAFMGCSALTEIVIPDSVTKIDQGVFKNCSSVKSAVLGKGVKYPPNDLFSGCYDMTELTVANISSSAGTRIGGAYTHDAYLATMFESSQTEEKIADYKLEKVTITEAEAVNPLQFKNLVNLTEVVLPNEITYIGSNAFENCKKLAKIDLPDRITRIDNYAFSGCISLADMDFPKSLAEIGYNAFAGCTSLTELRIPDSVNKIESFAFRDCTGLKKLTFSSNLNSVVNNVLNGCTELEEMTISTISTYNGYMIGGAIISDSYLAKMFEDSADTEKLSNYKLRRIELTKGSVINPLEFRNLVNLEEVVIPLSVEKIPYSAFSGCASLSDVYYAGSVKDWEKVSVEGSNEPLDGAEIHYGISLIGDTEFDAENADAIRGKADIDGSGIIDVSDLTYLSLYLLGDLQFTEAAEVIADLDKDGELTLADLATLRMVISHKKTLE